VTPPVVTESVAGDTTTLPTGAIVEMTVTDEDLPSLVAVTFAEPALIPWRRPFASTVTAPLSELQAIARPVSVPPTESFVVAESCVV
jgi:hypothetical protein